tara:strand:- start:2178 stop:3227 length:1050 start_codon:yes stop_codon:yes gene_type:complete
MDYIQKTIELHNLFGKNDNYVQGAGGNISIKENDIIHIKKSGKHFREIKDKNDIISCNISKDDIQGVLNINNKQNLENQYNALIEDKISGKDRPSIELSFHVFGDKYTLHLHPTIVNILNCTKQGQEIIKQLCEDNENMSYVNYCKPGIILTDKIIEKRTMLNDITFLFNHGIIITGPSEESILERYELLENKLRKEIIYEEYKQDDDVELLIEDKIEKKFFIINNDFLRLQELNDMIDIDKEIFSKSHLYPDSAIYNIEAIAQQDVVDWKQTNKIIYDIKVTDTVKYKWSIKVFNKKETMFKIELFINRMKILYFARLNGFTPVFLDDNSVDELVNWDAEKYRQDLLK